MDPFELVKSSYDSIAAKYLADRGRHSADVGLLGELEARLARGAQVLDIGCGAGMPIAERLAKGFRVTGVDISAAQIEKARSAVPHATFHRANVLDWDMGDDAYDGICSYYALIHVPREHHEDLLRRALRALRPGGLAILCLGAEDIEADVADDYFGQRMFWSHFDAPTYLKMLVDVGFAVDRHWFVQDESCPSANHLFVLAQKP